jgi:hypothetical protein
VATEVWQVSEGEGDPVKLILERVMRELYDPKRRAGQKHVQKILDIALKEAYLEGMNWMDEHWRKNHDRA